MSNEQLLQEIIHESTREFNKILTHLESLGRTATIEEMEVSCRSGLRRISTRLMQTLIEKSDKGYQGTSIPCSCGKRAHFVGYRTKTVQTLLGDITFARAYYHCTSCTEGICPADDALGVSRRQISKALERSICRLATVESFECAAEDIYELTGASVSAKTAQVVAEGVGEKILSQMRKEAGEAVEGKVEIKAQEHPDVLCIAMDGKMIPLTSGQHRELKVAAVYDFMPAKGGKGSHDGELIAGHTSYLGQFAEPDVFGESVWAEASRRGGEAAREVVILGDGAHWIWNQAQNHWPEAVQILDFWHVSDHLWELGSALYGDATKKTKTFVSYKLDQIKAGKVTMVIKALSKLKVSGDEKIEKLRQTIGYLRTNRHRMKYPTYRNKGYHIGSGVVESACKQFGARLDQAGMRWTERGAGAIATLRAVRLSGRWDEYWQPVRQPLAA